MSLCLPPHLRVGARRSARCPESRASRAITRYLPAILPTQLMLFITLRATSFFAITADYHAPAPRFELSSLGESLPRHSMRSAFFHTATQFHAKDLITRPHTLFTPPCSPFSRRSLYATTPPPIKIELMHLRLSHLAQPILCPHGAPLTYYRLLYAERSHLMPAMLSEHGLVINTTPDA